MKQNIMFFLLFTILPCTTMLTMDIDKDTMLHKVVAKGNLGETLLHIVARIGKDQIVATLLKRHFDPEIKNEQGRTPLWIAAHHGHVKILELLKELVNFNTKDNNGRTSLHAAVSGDIQSKECIETIKILLKYGTDPFIKDNQGKTIFQITNDSKIKSFLEESYSWEIHQEKIDDWYFESPLGYTECYSDGYWYLNANGILSILYDMPTMKNIN